jgi:hypothetical protein
VLLMVGVGNGFEEIFVSPGATHVFRRAGSFTLQATPREMHHMMHREWMQRNLLTRRHFCHSISWTIETNVPSHLDFSQGCPAIDDLSHCGTCVLRIHAATFKGMVRY